MNMLATIEWRLFLFYSYDYKKGKRERARENNEPEENLVYVTVLMIIITGLNENHIYPHIGKIIWKTNNVE